MSKCHASHREYCGSHTELVTHVLFNFHTGRRTQFWRQEPISARSTQLACKGHLRATESDASSGHSIRALLYSTGLTFSCVVQKRNIKVVSRADINHVCAESILAGLPRGLWGTTFRLDIACLSTVFIVVIRSNFYSSSHLFQLMYSTDVQYHTVNGKICNGWGCVNSKVHSANVQSSGRFLVRVTLPQSWPIVVHHCPSLLRFIACDSYPLGCAYMFGFDINCFAEICCSAKASKRGPSNPHSLPRSWAARTQSAMDWIISEHISYFIQTTKHNYNCWCKKDSTFTSVAAWKSRLYIANLFTVFTVYQAC